MKKITILVCSLCVFNFNIINANALVTTHVTPHIATHVTPHTHSTPRVNSKMPSVKNKINTNKQAGKNNIKKNIEITQNKTYYSYNPFKSNFIIWYWLFHNNKSDYCGKKSEKCKTNKK